MRYRTLVSLGIAATLAALTAAGFAQTPPPQPSPSQPSPSLRGPQASDRSIVVAHRVVLRMIRALERDQRDYGGYRVKAIADLRQAAQDLEQAIQYDRAHEPQR
jgi:hypothetical protein